MQSQVGVVLVLGFLAGGVLACGPCTCSVGGSGVWSDLAGLSIANCSSLNSLTSVPKNLPTDIEGLNIEYCYGMRTLKKNALVSFPNLEVIYIRIGGLRSIESHAFKGLTNARIISLDNNQLTDLPDDIFLDTPNLVKVDLYKNKLQSLKRNLFANLKNLEYVDASINRITIVESNTFVNVPSFERLFLNDNRLTSLGIDFIDNTCNLKYLHLEKNPWQCEAPVCGVMEMVVRREMWSNWGRPECAGPPSLKGKKWADLKDNPLLIRCSPTEQCNGHAPDKGTPTGPTETCTPSVTTINGGQSVCTGNVIFRDDFNTVDETKWEKQYYIAGEPDFEFVTYEKQNIISSTGYLNLKATLRPNVENVNSLDFTDGCTGVTCIRNNPGLLTPPVIAGQVKSKFSFRYGKIEIKAKLPKGDWVYPQLYLETRDPTEVYNSGGRIWLAYSRGNADLKTKTGEQIGNTVLYAGPVLSARDSDRYSAAKVFKRPGGGKWSNSTYTFTYTWRPDGMTVEVDGNSMDILNSATSYNKELLVTLGIAAGGLTDFPDESQSGPHVKPWKKTTYQNTRVFYENKNNWLPTWKKEEATLAIASIKIWAL